MSKQWTGGEIAEMARGYQGAAILLAAAELDLFSALAARPGNAGDLARKLQVDVRGLTILLDALAALELVEKQGGVYFVPESVAACLTAGGLNSVLGMTQHQANCMRRWAHLAQTIKLGAPAYRQASVRGEDGDRASFIQAMNDASGPMARTVIGDLQPLRFSHVLDVGGASGTWTIELLRANVSARATLFDLPAVIPMAQARLSKQGLADRVKLAAGNFVTDDLPGGADLVWVSAIIHQQSRKENQELFRKCFEALVGGGQILIRDMVMDESRTSPVAGAFFAVNMLSATESGGTLTFSEIREDLEMAGFTQVSVRRKDPGMSSVVGASKA